MATAALLGRRDRHDLVRCGLPGKTMTFGPKEIKEARGMVDERRRDDRWSTWVAEVRDLRDALSQALDALEEQEARIQEAITSNVQLGYQTSRAEKAERERDEARRLLADIVRDVRELGGLVPLRELHGRAEAVEARVMELRQENERLRDKLLSPEHPALQLVMSEGDQLRADLLRERERVMELEKENDGLLGRLETVILTRQCQVDAVNDMARQRDEAEARVKGLEGLLGTFLRQEQELQTWDALDWNAARTALRRMAKTFETALSHPKEVKP